MADGLPDGGLPSGMAKGGHMAYGYDDLWGFDDPESRRIFLEGPTTTELTELLRKQIRGSGVTNAIEDE